MQIIKTIAGAAVGAAMATGAFAADVTLTIASWAPPTHGMNAKMWPEFIRMVEEASGGTVSGEVKLGLAPPPAMMDLVLDGAADVTWIFHGYNAGRFTATQLIELPGFEGSAEAASVAYQKVFDQYLAALEEHRGVKVLAMMTHGPAAIHTNKEVKTLADVSGMKLRVPGGVGSTAGEALGAIGIQVPAPKVYETLASNAADGVVMPVETRKGFKLTEVAKNLYLMPGGFYRGSFAIIMNQDTFDSLPEDVRAALDEKVFGEPLARMAGATWDEMDAEGLAVTKEAGDNTITDASAEDVAAYGAIADAIKADVLAALAEKGVDAEAAYAMIKSEMAGN